MRNLKKKDKSKTNSKVSSNAKSKYERSETFSVDWALRDLSGSERAKQTS